MAVTGSVGIRVRDLAHRFGATEALRGVTLDVGEGRFAALLGPNGAGKSTLVDAVCTVLAPDRGEIHINGTDVRARPVQARSDLGVVFQTQTLDTRLTAEENLALHAAAWGVRRRERAERIGESLRLAGLEAFADRRASGLSSGQRRRLEIARALLHRPGVLVLDEPTVGLDTEARAALWEHIGRLRETRRITILATTHYIGEVEMADDVFVLSRGVIVAQGSPAELRHAHGRTRLLVEPRDALARKALRAMLPEAQETGDILSFRLDDTADIARLQQDCAPHARTMTLERASLEAAYLALTRPEA